MESDFTQLNTKIDRLLELVEAQERRVAMLEELAQDALPIANAAMKSVTRELAELDGQFSMEAWAALGKRVAVNAPRLHRLLDLFEAGTDLLDEAQLLSKPLFARATHAIGQLDERGYLNFAREGLRVADRVATEFSAEDVRALGDNIVTILATVRNMTQPDLMALANRAADTLHEPATVAEDVSPWALLREMNDPQVRRGLARMLRVVKSLAEQPESLRSN